MFPHSFLPTWREKADVCAFGDLANQETEFMGVQSNLQSYFNYRSENKRLEMNFKLKSDKIKDFQECFSSNSFYYNILKELCQKFW